MSADLEEMAQPPAVDWVPTEAELSSSDRDKRTKAWDHILKGKVLVPASIPVTQGMEMTHFSESKLPPNQRIIPAFSVELMDYDDTRLTIMLDENEKVKEVAFR